MTDLDHDNDVIDLGAASVETKGGGERVMDSFNTLQPIAGISDD